MCRTMDKLMNLCILFTLLTFCQMWIVSGQFYCKMPVADIPCNVKLARLSKTIKEQKTEIEFYKKQPDHCEKIEQQYTNLQIELLNQMTDWKKEINGLPRNLVKLLDTSYSQKLNSSNLHGFKIQTDQLVSNLTRLAQRLDKQTQLSSKLNKCETIVAELQSNISSYMANVDQNAAEIAQLRLKEKVNSKLIEKQKKSLDKLEVEKRQMLQQLKQNATDMVKWEAELSYYKNQVDELKAAAAADAQILQDLEVRFKAYASTCRAESCQAFGNTSGVFVINLPNLAPFEVLCNGDVAGPGWTVIQRRVDNSVSFNRSWREYQQGFGDLKGNFFLGLEKLHLITHSRPQQLYILLESFDNETRFAQYDSFVIGSASEKYAMSELGTYTGTAGDDLRLSEHQKFSTFDQDNDAERAQHCASIFSSGWWFNACGVCNLNGNYYTADTDYDANGKGIFWSSWLDTEYSLKSSLMMIRPKAN